MLKKITIMFSAIFLICLLSPTVFALSPAYVTNISIVENSEIIIRQGETITIRAEATPDGLNYACVAWFTDDESVVNLKTEDSTIKLNPPISSVEITALKPGVATITAYASLDPVVDNVWYDVCDSIKITVVDHSVADRNECEELYNISYYTDISYYANDTEGRITSLGKLSEQFPECDEILSKYDEAFFEDKFLYRINYTAPDPSLDVKVTAVTNTEDSISIDVSCVQKQVEGALPTIEVPWDIILEMDKSLADKSISSKIKYERFINTIYDEAFDKNDSVLIEIIPDSNNDNKVIMVDDDELYYNSQKDVFIGLVDASNINEEERSVPIVVTAGTPTSFTYGNLDDDDAVDASDLQIMKLVIKGKEALTGQLLIASDLDGDGLCDASDLHAMKLKIKSNKEFPVLK